MYEYRASVVKVVDGDTVDFNVDMGFHITVQDRFRLNGIDTPELHASDPTVRAAAVAAKEALTNLLASATTITIQTQKNEGDKYGRWLVTIQITKADSTVVSVVDWMLANGYGKPYDGGAKT